MSTFETKGLKRKSNNIYVIMQKLVIFIPVTDQVKEKCHLFPQMDFEMTAFIFAYFHIGSNFQSAVWSVCVSVYVSVCVCVVIAVRWPH